MARPSQIEFPGAIYHVMSRGNRKQASTPRSLSGPAKPVRGRRPTNLKPETGLDPAKPLIKSIPQNLLECLVVGRFLEQLHSRHAAIQEVKNHSTRSDPRCSWHRRTIIQNSPSCQYRTCPVFPPLTEKGPAP